MVKIAFNSYIPNDSFFQYQWNYENTGQIHGKTDADVDASLAWEICKGDSTLRIAVIDQGVEPHEDIGPLEPGYDVAGAGIWTPQPDSNPTPGDLCAHGQACAGLIAATQNNVLGITGLAPLCRIVPIKIAPDQCFAIPMYDASGILAEAFYRAAAAGAKVASNSWVFTDRYSVCQSYLTRSSKRLIISLDQDHRIPKEA